MLVLRVFLELGFQEAQPLLDPARAINGGHGLERMVRR